MAEIVGWIVIVGMVGGSFAAVWILDRRDAAQTARMVAHIAESQRKQGDDRG